MPQHGSVRVGLSTIMSTLASQGARSPPPSCSPTSSHQVPASQGTIKPMEGVPLCPGCRHHSSAQGHQALTLPTSIPEEGSPRSHLIPGGQGGASTCTAPAKAASPSPHKQDHLPTASAELHLPPGSAPAWHGLSSFSSLSHSLNVLCLLWRRGAGRAPLTPPAPGDPPRQMGLGYECAHSEAPKRICWRPFHCEPLSAAPLRWDAPEFSPGFSPFHSRRKESAYKGLVCPTCLRGPYCCRCRGSWHDSVAPLRKGDVRLPPGRVRAGGLARRWEKRFQLHFNVH